MVFPYLVLIALAYRIDPGNVPDVIGKILGDMSAFRAGLNNLSELANLNTWQICHLSQLLFAQPAALKDKLSL